MKQFRAVCTTMLVCALALFGQAPNALPKPGPEHKALERFAGTWHIEGQMKQTPMSPAGAFAVTEHNEFFPGGFFLISHADVKSPMGEGKSMATFGYDRREKSYTLNAINSMGMASSARGTVEGDTWTWNSDNVFGMPMKGRFVIKEISATATTVKLEV